MIVSWLTTNRCNLACKHCYQDAGERMTDELSTPQAKAMIDGIARAGFRIMIFSGGEPLLRDDIFELVAYAAAQGLRPVFGTNGTLLSRETVMALKRSGAAAMGVSVDSLDRDRHDDFRGVTGAFQRTMDGLRNCREVGLPFQLHTTVMDWNRDELLALTDFAVAAGAAAHYLFFLIPVGRGIGMEAQKVEVQAYEELLHAIMEKQKTAPLELKPTCAPQFLRVAQAMGVDTRFTRGCLAGLSYCIVGPDGRVRPCAYMTQQAGDVREQSFDAIWRESAVFARLRTRAYGGVCGRCDYEAGCGGCRARAEYYHGDYMAEDSYCAHALVLRAES